MNSSSPNQLLTVAEVAARLRIGHRTLYRWIDDGKLPVLRLAGTTIRVAARDLDEWLRIASQPVEPGNPSTPQPAPAPAPAPPRAGIPPAPWSKRRRTKGER